VDPPDVPPARSGPVGSDTGHRTLPDRPERDLTPPRGTRGTPPLARGGRRGGGWWSEPPVGTVTVTEIVTLSAAGLVGVLATVSLATAHLGVFGLAQVLVATLVIAGGLAALARSRAAALPGITLDPAGLLPVAAGGALALVLFLPGFHYATGGADPGVYVMHAIAISRDHSVWIHDPLLAAANLPVQVAGPGARFPGIWISDAATGTIFPQFYHLWPALLATSYDVG